MAAYYPSITDEQLDLIQGSKMFFVASADPHLAHGPHEVGPVNVSPRGGVPLHVLDRNRVAFLDFVGSGNETARHSQAGGPLTLMVCSFDEDAAIVRLFGKGRVTPLHESPLAELLLKDMPPGEPMSAMRQAIEVEVERTMTSCGYGVPLFSYERERSDADRGRKYKRVNR